MCSQHQQSRKLLRGDLHLPQDRVYILCKSGERSGHYPVLRAPDKRKRSAEMEWLAVQAIVGLGEHAEHHSHSLSQLLGMRRILSAVKPHLACLSWAALTGLLQKGPPSAIHRSMPDGPEEKDLQRLEGGLQCCIPLLPHSFRYNTRKKKKKSVVALWLSTTAWLQTSQWAGVSSVLTRA